jgi:hypothetical protein
MVEGKLGVNEIVIRLKSLFQYFLLLSGVVNIFALKGIANKFTI